MTGDVAALLLLRFLMRGVRDYHWLGPTIASLSKQMIPPGALPSVQLVPAVLLGLIVLNNYGSSDARRDAPRLLAGATLGLTLPFWSYAWSNFSPIALPGFIIVAAIVGCGLILERYVIDRLVRTFRPISPHAARALVVGSSEEVIRALQHPALADGREFAIGGFFDPKSIHMSPHDVADLCRTLERCQVDTMVLSGPLNDEAFATLIDAASAAGCQVLGLARAFSLGGVEPRVVWRRGVPLVQLTRPALRGRQLIIKRALDVTLSTLGLVVLSPVYIAIAAAVRLSSPGRILFRQMRVGIGGRHFRIVKFRSMVPDAEDQRAELMARSLYRDERLFKVEDDPRVTRVGAFLRRTSLDELPQLWNVLKGEMSLVGPRPPLPSEVDLYQEHHYARFDVKPGVTGPWQVNGRNQIRDFEEVIRLETAYIKDWTLWKDLAILLRTIPVVFRMQGAH